MERAKFQTTVAQQPQVKRRWGDLIWEGASEGGLRQSRRLRTVDAAPATEVARAGQPAADATPVLASVVSGLVFGVTWAVPIASGAAPLAPRAMAQVTGSAVWAVPVAAGGGEGAQAEPAEERGRAEVGGPGAHEEDVGMVQMCDGEVEERGEQRCGCGWDFSCSRHRSGRATRFSFRKLIGSS